MRRLILATTVVTALLCVATIRVTTRRALAHYDETQRPQPERFVPGRLLVKFRENVASNHARNIIAALGAREAEEISNLGVHILDLPEDSNERAFASSFAARPEVEFSELDRILEPAEVAPNDPWYVDEWHLNKIGAPSAWSTTVGAGNVIVAILDGGVDATHPDLAPNIVSGWNTYDNNADTSDPGGHGTKVAGSAIAASNNGIGIAGVAWTCKIMPVRIADATGATTYSAIAAGINWAADHGARVANVSYTATDSATVQTAARYMQNKGGVVTMSAGNASTFDSTADTPYILTVSATDTNDALTSFSNTGNNVDLAAPGMMIRTTARGGGYESVAGTSFSSPIAAGVAALVISSSPALSGAEVQDILKKSADDLGPAGWDPSYGWGRVNAARAVALAGGGSVADTTPPTVNIVSPISGATVSGMQSVSVSAADNVGVGSVTLAIDGGIAGALYTTPYTFSWNTTLVSNGPHTLLATVTDLAGNSSSCSVTTKVSNVPADTTAPIVTITNPVNGGTVSGIVSVMVNVSDAVGVVKNELYVDGLLEATGTSAPFATKWNTRKVKAGLHTLQCKAYDAAGNVGVSQNVTVSK